ncbi:hypothetical protein AMECASPLE_000638 [Ameca splendens]|uniref:Uncharacterized protein n=1 Tax=Ameca splendens TaxID=208324 RepID=A0ABV1A465_9TELE
MCSCLYGLLKNDALTLVVPVRFKINSPGSWSPDPTLNLRCSLFTVMGSRRLTRTASITCWVPPPAPRVGQLPCFYNKSGPNSPSLIGHNTARCSPFGAADWSIRLLVKLISLTTDLTGRQLQQRA